MLLLPETIIQHRLKLLEAQGSPDESFFTPPMGAVRRRLPWMGINVLVAGVVGGSLPFIIKRMGKDPAMMTGPFLTTVTDITGVSIYLGLSTLFLTRILG